MSDAPYLTTESLAALTRKRHKYRASPTDYNGVRYASKAEATRAAELDMLVKSGSIWFWQAQPKRHLGDLIYVPDFLVVERSMGTDSRKCLLRGIWFEDVKGVETSRFKQVRKLWPKYGPCDLHILNRKGNGWDVEIIEPVRVESM